MLFPAILAGTAAMAAPAADTGFSIIPAPLHIQSGKGSFMLTPQTRILTESGNAALQQVAKELAAGIRRQSGLSLTVGALGGYAGQRRVPPFGQTRPGHRHRLATGGRILCRANHFAAAAHRRCQNPGPAGGRDRGQTALRLARPHARRGALLLPGRLSQKVHRLHGAAQTQHLSLAPDGRPWLADRDQEVSPPHHRGRVAQRHTVHQQPRQQPPSRRLLHAGRNKGSGGLRPIEIHYRSA
ncbi:unnamed protein product [Adineta ricciae]|uniref:Uncharacterized protein n=1 Tax=Adineta ricciae TaxID=249248 RepID=A0A815SWG8_ADIRI|nr:unnamed protein product [Adineta ricciae]